MTLAETGDRALRHWGTARNLTRGGAIRARFVQGTFWSAAASLASQLPSLGVSIALGRVLGMGIFGELAAIQATILALSTMGDLGLNLATTRFVAAHRTSRPTEAGRAIGFALCATLGFGTVLALGLVLFAGPYAQGILRAPQLAWYLRCSALFLVCEMLSRAQVGSLAGFEAFRGVARLNLVRGLLLLLVPVAASLWGLSGAILCFTVASLATCIAAQSVLLSTARADGIAIVLTRHIPDPALLRLAGSLWASLLAIGFATWASTSILIRQPHGLAEMAVFSAADRWKAALVFLPAVLAQATTPLIANTNGRGNRAACARILLASSAVSGGATLLLVLVMLVLAPALMGAYGWPRGDSGQVLVVTCLGCVPVALYSQGSAALWTLGRPRKMLGIDLVRAALLLSLAAVGFGGTALGLAWANVLSIAGAGALLLVAVRAQLNTPPDEARL